MTLPSAADSGLLRSENGYDVLRLLLAAAVIFAHSYPIGGFGNNPIDGIFQHQMLMGHIAVLGFFGLSGFLVAASCERSSGPVAFLRKRFLRIFPGYWVCLLACALVFAPLISVARGNFGTIAWNGSDGAVGYVLRNFFLMIRQQSIGTLLAGMPHHGDLNSSLWSLWPEFFCYACLAAVGVSGGLTHNRPLVLVGVLLLGGFHFVRQVNPSMGFPLFPVQIDNTIYLPFFLSFAVGAGLFAWRESFRPSLSATLVLALVTLYVLRTGGFVLTGPFLIPLLVVFLGACFRLHLKYDFSYGLYIYSFPVQQLLTAWLPNRSWPVYLALSVVLSLICAIASWFLIERHFLRARTPAPRLAPC